MDEQTYRDGLAHDGFGAAEEKTSVPNFRAKDHTHPFDVRGYVLAGEFRLNLEGVETAYGPGQIFTLTAGCVHHEAAGAEGAKYLIGRRPRP